MKKTLLILALLIPFMLNAQNMGMHHRNSCSDGMKGLKGLNLTDAQQEQIRKLQIKSQKDAIKLQADLKLANIELHELIQADKTGAKLDKAIAKVSDLKNKLFKARINKRMAIRKVLTAEQRKKMTANCMNGMHGGKSERMMQKGNGCGDRNGKGYHDRRCGK